MKKLILTLFLISFLAVLVVPQAALAQDKPLETCKITRDLSDIGDECKGTKAIPKPVPMEGFGMCCLVQTLYNITDWLFMVFVALAGIFVLLGAFNILTAGGNAEKVTSGRNYIIYAAIGLAVGFLARAIPGIVKAIVGT